jgi:hypothetical protein
MNTKKVMSIVALVTAATIFALSSVLVNPVLAQSTIGGAGGTEGSTAGGTEGSTAGGNDSLATGGSAGSVSADYEEFQMCLSDAETSGVATEEQIRECFNPIYNENGDSSSDENDGSGSDNSGDTEEDTTE